MHDRFRSARQMAGLSQAQIARELGVARSAVAQWERQGGTYPNVKNLAEAAKLLRVRFEWLATGRGLRELDPSHVVPESPTHAVETRTPEEKAVIAMLRRMPGKKRELVRAIVQNLAEESAGRPIAAK